MTHDHNGYQAAKVGVAGGYLLSVIDDAKRALAEWGIGTREAA